MATDEEIIEAFDRACPSDYQRPFLLGYEMPRLRALNDVLTRHSPHHKCVRVLNIGYLTGLVPFVLFHLSRFDEMTIVSTERGEADALQAGYRHAGLFPESRHSLLPLDLDTVDEGGDLEAWKQYYGSFDCIVMGEVIEHIPSVHAPKILRFFHKLLGRNGVVVFTTPNLHGLMMRLRHLIGADFLHDPSPHSAMGYGHVNLYSARLLCDLGRAEAFEVAEVRYSDFTNGPKLRDPRAKLASRVCEVVRRRTVSALWPETRDDLMVCLRKSETGSKPSVIYNRHNVGIGEARRAVKQATKPGP